MTEELIVKLKRPHPAQRQILDEAKRFNVLKCGRRFGKTDLSVELVAQPLLDGFPVAYYYPVYKDGDDIWRDIKQTLHDVIREKSEQSRSLTLITGGKLDFWSLDHPDGGRGRKYKRVIIDEAEKAPHLKDAWEQTIRATLADYKGDAWFLSTPKFGVTYFKNTLFTNEKAFDDWKSWRFTTYDNPHMDKAEIDAAKAQLDPLVFKCEFLAEDVDIVGRPFAWAFNKAKHVTQDLSNPVWRGDPSQYLYLSFDFNLDPITCLVAHHIDGVIYIIDVISINNSNIYELCNRIMVKYSNYMMLITGDATGRASSALTKDNINYYQVILRELRLLPTQLRLPAVNPSIEENSVLVNSILTHKPVQIHPVNAERLIFDLQYVEIGDNNKIKKDNRSDERQHSDALDCFRYFCNTFHKQELNLRR